MLTFSITFHLLAPHPPSTRPSTTPPRPESPSRDRQGTACQPDSHITCLPSNLGDGAPVPREEPAATPAHCPSLQPRLRGLSWVRPRLTTLLLLPRLLSPPHQDLPWPDHLCPAAQGLSPASPPPPPPPFPGPHGTGTVVPTTCFGDTALTGRPGHSVRLVPWPPDEALLGACCHGRRTEASVPAAPGAGGSHGAQRAPLARPLPASLLPPLCSQGRYPERGLGPPS